MGLIKQNVTYRIASFVRPVKMKTNYCCVTDATKAITHTASNQKWSTFPMAIGRISLSHTQIHTHKNTRWHASQIPTTNSIEPIFIFCKHVGIATNVSTRQQMNVNALYVEAIDRHHLAKWCIANCAHEPIITTVTYRH